MSKVKAWFANALLIYAQPKIWIILLLGFSSGLPLALTASTLTAWLQDAHIDKTSIGLFAAIATPYSLKFLWAPLIDALPFPILSHLFGRRRGWILAMQLALIAAIIGMGLANPANGAWTTAAWALLVAFLSASQDIVIDAYRVEILEKEQYGAGAAAVQYGYRLGMLASGAGALALADHFSWQVTYAIMASLMGIGVITTLLSKEPEIDASCQLSDVNKSNALTTDNWQLATVSWLRTAVLEPFADFMTRRYWLMILLFIILYKLGDAFLGIMTNPFLLEIGFSKTDIAKVVKSFGLIATLVGLFIGGIMTQRLGSVRTLFICGIGHALTNLMFLVQARSGADVHILMLGITLENLSGGMTAAAFVAFLSSLTHVHYTATQYALLSSLAAMGRTWLTTTAGWTVDHFGWETFFIVSVALSLPGLLTLWWLSKKMALDTKS